MRIFYFRGCEVDFSLAGSQFLTQVGSMHS
jgi:hypothetical protein